MDNVAIKFTITNPSDHVVMACLIAALVRQPGKLKGRYLSMDGFKAMDDDTELLVSDISEADASDLQEFVQHYDIEVTGAKLHSQNMDQASANFIAQVYKIFKGATDKPIQTTATLGDINGPDKGKIIHRFWMPFLAVPDVSLVLPILANTTVEVELNLIVPGISQAA